MHKAMQYIFIIKSNFQDFFYCKALLILVVFNSSSKLLLLLSSSCSSSFIRFNRCHLNVKMEMDIDIVKLAQINNAFW